MPTYLVERYLPGRDRAWIEAAVDRLQRQRRTAAHLGSTYVAAEDACFCRFEAETADDVRDANEIAGVPLRGSSQPRRSASANQDLRRKEIGHETHLRANGGAGGRCLSR